MEELRGPLDAMQDPQMRHAALVHLPVALSLLALLVAAASAFAAGKNHSLRWTAFAAYVLLGAACFSAAWSGDEAHAEIGEASQAAHELVEEHEELGERAWMFAGAAAALLLIAAVPKPAVRVITGWAAVSVGVAGAGWMAVTAHHGGELVYEHGVGTPGATSTRSVVVPAATDPRVAFFREEVRPILADACFRCHNPARSHRAGGLDQTTIAGMLAGGESGPALVPGDPDGSLLIKAVTWEDELFQMPPDDDQLEPEQIDVLRRWIREGAVWDGASAPASAPPKGEADDHDDDHDD